MLLSLHTMQRSFSLDQIEEVVTWLLTEFAGQKIMAFHAEMGRGKTTLIRALCKQLGVDDGVSSPTFSIIQEYQGRQQQRIFHMDWYRLKNEDEAIEAGVEDVIRQTEAYVFVEWPEIALGLLPSQTLHIELDIVDETTRVLRIQSA